MDELRLTEVEVERLVLVVEVLRETVVEELRLWVVEELRLTEVEVERLVLVVLVLRLTVVLELRL